jgi:hypothetical protein
MQKGANKGNKQRMPEESKDREGKTHTSPPPPSRRARPPSSTLVALAGLGVDARVVEDATLFDLFGV